MGGDHEGERRLRWRRVDRMLSEGEAKNLCLGEAHDWMQLKDVILVILRSRKFPAAI